MTITVEFLVLYSATMACPRERDGMLVGVGDFADQSACHCTEHAAEVLALL